MSAGLQLPCSNLVQRTAIIEQELHHWCASPQLHEADMQFIRRPLFSLEEEHRIISLNYPVKRVIIDRAIGVCNPEDNKQAPMVVSIF